MLALIIYHCNPRLFVTNQLSLIELPYLPDSTRYFKHIARMPRPVWLDSAYPDYEEGQFDILSAAPSHYFVNPTITNIESAIAPFTRINKEKLPFIGGAIGYFNYEYSHTYFGLKHTTPNETLAEVGIYDWAIILDHKNKYCVAVFQPSCQKEFKDEITSILMNTLEQHNIEEYAFNMPSFHVSPFVERTSKVNYLKKVDKIKSLIFAGDTYQVNLSQEYYAKFNGSTSEAYLTLRKASPSPYSAFLGFDHSHILSLSPEQFIAINHGKASTQPIKGTIARLNDVEADSANKKLLLESDKNHAENLMIVDLLRNDFNKVCLPYTVKTEYLFTLKSFTNVHHLVSKVSGTISPDVSNLTFFMNCFPGGSITGAPKKRAMEIIDTIEDHKRGIYCGSIFYLSACGKMDSNITIRTLKIKGNTIHCYGGGGIVADSINTEEYEESVQKVKNLMDALAAN